MISNGMRIVHMLCLTAITSSINTSLSGTQNNRRAMESQNQIGQIDVKVLAEVARELERGEALQAKGNLKGAVDAYSSGIAKLENRYMSPEVNDDTGMKLGLGKSEAAKGNWETAANLFHNVLRDRINLYKSDKRSMKDEKSASQVETEN